MEEDDADDDLTIINLLITGKKEIEELSGDIGLGFK